MASTVLPLELISRWLQDHPERWELHSTHRCRISRNRLREWITKPSLNGDTLSIQEVLNIEDIETAIDCLIIAGIGAWDADVQPVVGGYSCWTPRNESQTKSFGNYAQTVLHLLIGQGYDNPYESMTPQYDPDGKIFDALHLCWEMGLEPEIAVERVATIREGFDE